MVQKDQLFALVKSLSQGEKAYFIKSLPQSTKKNESTDYLLLFYTLDKMEEYDEEKLKERLKDKAFVKHIAVIKNYLFNLIVKQLKSFRDESSIKNELYEVLQEAEVLLKKALYKESYRVLQKAEKTAEKYEFFIFSQEIYDRLLRLNYDLLIDIDVNNYSLKIYEKQKIVFSQIAEIAELKYLRNIRNDIHLGKGNEAIKEKKRLKLLENPLLKDGYKFKSYNAGVYHYHLRGRILMHCSDIKNREKAYLVTKKLVSHLESDPELLKINPINYSTALNNLVYTHYQVKTKDHDGALKIINKIAEIKSESQYLKYRIQEKVIVNMLVYYLLSKKQKEGIAYIKQIEKELIENEASYNSDMFLSAIDSFSILCFLNEEYSKSLKYVNMILNHKSTLRLDIHCFSKVLNLLIHYELGNSDHLEYILKPTQRFLIKNNSFETYHKVIVLFLKDVVFELDQTELQNKFKSLSKSLSVIEKMDAAKMVFSLFNFREWADKKAASLNIK
jgi:hypothetical protein